VKRDVTLWDGQTVATYHPIQSSSSSLLASVVGQLIRRSNPNTVQPMSTARKSREGYGIEDTHSMYPREYEEHRLTTSSTGTSEINTNAMTVNKAT